MRIPFTARALCLLAGALALALPAGADDRSAGSSKETFEVVETGPRAYQARGSFVVAATAAAAWEAIADYAAIPRIAPSVKVSRIVSRDGGKVMVEQEAVAAFLFFSKRIHLLLEIVESPPGEVKFRDTARREFTHYEGFWTIEEAGDGVRVSYGIDVERGFSAPDFLAKRFFKKQAESLMDSMREEILRRAAASVPSTGASALP